MNWISVKDKMPPDCSGYAIRSIQLICNDGFVTVGYYYPKFLSDENQWVDAKGCMITKQVTHWMPLPPCPDLPKEN